MEDEDEYSLFDEPLAQDGPGLFDDALVSAGERIRQDSTDLFAEGASFDVAPPPSKLSTGKPPAVPDAPLALYRRYRPDTFAEVIGQDHVTVPLQRALDHNKVGHAYLFSGPRGCGKTTSARILARCLNCEQGPTATPCGQCQSCRDLARGGPGSIDVIEIDAASHGGVDDARDLRERAFFAPIASRYKIYIVDEAHMVTAGGFNALLKLVEEPPPHAKFIFATTEPEKVIGTIRSRTHHYPFRLVPPKTLATYLQEICEEEGVDVDQKVLPLVVRAGAGSVRDSLSVLDQLLGGAGDDGLEYEQAAALLGFTPESLLDDIVDAFAAGDGGGVFKTIDRVIEVGQDPRRFAEDLLRRLRDLVILNAVPSAIDDGILDVAVDQGERLKSQAAGLGGGELARAAEVIATGLTEMRGTTAPRLHLELMCARVLLPGADLNERGLHARMDRLERRVGMMDQTKDAPAPVQWSDVPSATDAETELKTQGERSFQPESLPQRERRDQDEMPAVQPEQRRAPAKQRPAGAPPAGQQTKWQHSELDQAAAQPRSSASKHQPASEKRLLTAEELRRAWPSVLEEVKRRRRFTYMLLSQNAQVLDLSDGVLTLGFANSGSCDNFSQGSSRDFLLDSLIEVLGLEVRVQAIVANERLAERGQRRVDAVKADPVQRLEPEPQISADAPPQDRLSEPLQAQAAKIESPREPSLYSPSGDDPALEYTPLSADDKVFDGAQNAEELLRHEFGAEIIAVAEDEPTS